MATRQAVNIPSNSLAFSSDTEVITLPSVIPKTYDLCYNHSLCLRQNISLLISDLLPLAHKSIKKNQQLTDHNNKYFI